MKYCSEELVIPITLLFAASLKSCYFPLAWKSSYIFPLHKSGNRSLIDNYRGIAKLSAMPKLLEAIITSQLSHSVKSLISPFQHGFLSGKSTVTNLLEFTSKTIENFGKGLQTDVIYTDFSKAFDVVNHKLLTLKLTLLGFPTPLVLWIISYLTNRTQSVIFNLVKSEEFSVTSGVPQGSHLGPLLFLLFINDLPSVVIHSNILLYADDVKLFLSYKNEQDSFFLQTDLDHLCDWCEINCMKLNLKKCKHMTFSRRQPSRSKYKISDYTLESLEVFDDLGVTMDPKLRFHIHINKAISRANSTLGFIKRWSKEFNDPLITKTLFTSLVRPILEYASIVWCPRYGCYIDDIESVQKQFLLFCLRNIYCQTNIHLPPYEYRLQLINLPALKNRRTMLNVCWIYKLIHGLVDSPYLLSKIYFNIPLRPRRSFELLFMNFCRTNYLQNEPLRSACGDFNYVSEVISFNETLYSIKLKILDYLQHRH